MWDELYRRRRAFISSFLVLIPGSVLAGIVTEALLPGALGFFLVAAAGLAFYLWSGRRLARWPCPRCGRYFSVLDMQNRYWPLVSSCRHCGLEIGSGEIKPPAA
jgi:predicted RNA-binding Zn-ribbon protein involved in translation (DUF1610 family)